MDFLNVLTIKKSPSGTATIKHRHFVRITGPNGEEIEGTRGVRLGLHEAKRRLEALPGPRRRAGGRSRNDNRRPPSDSDTG